MIISKSDDALESEKAAQQLLHKSLEGYYNPGRNSVGYRISQARQSDNSDDVVVLVSKTSEQNGFSTSTDYSLVYVVNVVAGAYAKCYEAVYYDSHPPFFSSSKSNECSKILSCSRDASGLQIEIEMRDGTKKLLRY